MKNNLQEYNDTVREYKNRTIELVQKGSYRTELETYELEKLFWNYPCGAKIPIPEDVINFFDSRLLNGIGYASDKNRAN
jgi:hypothetical protein